MKKIELKNKEFFVITDFENELTLKAKNYCQSYFNEINSIIINADLKEFKADKTNNIDIDTQKKVFKLKLALDNFTEINHIIACLIYTNEDMILENDLEEKISIIDTFTAKEMKLLMPFLVGMQSFFMNTVSDIFQIFIEAGQAGARKVSKKSGA